MGDWDRKPKDPPSAFLRLKSKGEYCRIRIASAPYRELRVWPSNSKEPPLKAELIADLTPGQWLTLLRDPGFDVSEVFHLIVIDRADGNAKVFTTTAGAYGKMRDYATNPEWGDPRGYDFTVTRTEQPGKNYYEVVPSPNKSDLTAAELAKADALALSLHDKLPAALPASGPQPDDLDDSITPEELPWNTPLPKLTAPPVIDRAAPAADKPAVDYQAKVQQSIKDHKAAETPDEVIEDIGSGAVNLDDVPF